MVFVFMDGLDFETVLEKVKSKLHFKIMSFLYISVNQDRILYNMYNEMEIDRN